jgi:hypothetical protein
VKKIIVVFIMLFSLNVAANSAETVLGKVNGLVCMECQLKLTRSLTDVAGVKATIQVAWPEGVALVASKDSVNITEDEFVSIVQNNGFELQKITKVDQYISSPSDGLKILKSIN